MVNSSFPQTGQEMAHIMLVMRTEEKKMPDEDSSSLISELLAEKEKEIWPIKGNVPNPVNAKIKARIQMEKYAGAVKTPTKKTDCS